MAWSDAARAAAAEVRRRNAKTSGAKVAFDDARSFKVGNSGPGREPSIGYHAFMIQSSRENPLSAHRFFFKREVPFSKAKAVMIAAAKRISVRIRRKVFLDRI